MFLNRLRVPIQNTVAGILGLDMIMAFCYSYSLKNELFIVPPIRRGDLLCPDML